MADTGLFSFFAGAPADSAMSYPAMEARRKIALQMLANSGRKGYPKTFGEGLTAIGDALGDIGAMRGLSAQEAAYQKQATAAAEGAVPAEARTPAVPGPQASTDTETDTTKPTAYAATDETAAEPAVNRAATPAVATAPPPTEVEPGVAGPSYNALDATGAADPWPARRNAIAGIETGGEKNPYTSLGTANTHSGDRAHGKYQIMGANIPSWTQAATGTALTPQQFLASPAAQEATFQHRFGQYVDKYGENGAARAWYAGEHGMNKLDATDLHERLSVRDYGNDYMRRLAPLMRDRVAGAVTPPPDPQPQAALPLSATADQPTDLPPEITRGFSATPQAQSQIRTAPPIQLAQATPPGGLPPVRAPLTGLPQREVPPPITTGPPPARMPIPADVPMSEDLKRGYQIRAREQAMGIPREMQQGQGLIDYGENQRKQLYDARLKDWQDTMLARRQQEEADRAFNRGAPERELARQQAEVALAKGKAFGGIEQAELFKPIAASAKSVEAIPMAQTAIRNARQAATEGNMFTGSSAEIQLSLKKMLSSAGFPTDPRIVPTEEFRSFIKPILASARQALVGGANISDSDMKIAEAAVGGDIKLDRNSIVGILGSLERMNTAVAIGHQRKLEAVAGDDPQRQSALFGVYGLPMENVVPREAINLLKSQPTPEVIDHFNRKYRTPGLAQRILGGG